MWWKVGMVLFVNFLSVLDFMYFGFSWLVSRFQGCGCV